MADLVKNGDFETLVYERYAERGRFKETDLKKMVSEFEGKLKTRFMTMIEKARSIAPEINSEGTEAIYKGEQFRLMLTKGDDGRWGFNM